MSAKAGKDLKDSKAAKNEKPLKTVRSAAGVTEAPEDTAGDGVHLWLLVMKAYHAMSTYAAPSLRSSELGDSDFRVLEVLLHKGALPVNAIGVKVHLTPGSISAAVDRLLERGFVTRIEDKQDRRIRRVDLTAEGRKVVAKAFKAHAAEMNELADGLSGSERRALAEGLRKLGKRAEKKTRPEA